jgi:hypothetical protein
MRPALTIPRGAQPLTQLYKYITKPRAAEQIYDDPYASTTATEVIVQGDSPVKTGLLDARGEPLYRVMRRQPIGFDLRGRQKTRG